MSSIFRLHVTEKGLSFPDKGLLQKKLESLKPGMYSIELKRKSRLRSHQQNKYLRALYTIVSNDTGDSEDDIHSMMQHRFLLIEKKIGDEVMRFVRSTTSLSTEEMTEFIEKVRKFWGEQGVFLPDSDSWYLLSM